MPMKKTDASNAGTNARVVLTDAGDLPKRSRRDDFFLTLKLVGIAIIILSVIWGIEYLQNR